MKKNSERVVARGAFTLVEVLVSLTVLSMLVFLVANITGAATKGITGGQNRIQADSEARAVFNRLAIDLARMIRRADIEYTSFKRPIGNEQEWNDHFRIYSEVPGYFGDTLNKQSPYSIVGYQLIGGGTYFPGTVLQRASKGQPWESPITPGVVPTLAAGDYQTVGGQVFRMEYTYLRKPTATLGPRLSIDPGDLHGLKDVSAIVVGIAVLDSSSRTLSQMSAGGGTWSDSDLVEDFPDARDDKDILAAWMPKVTAGGLAASSGIPAKAADAVRVYQRYFYLDKQ